MHPVSITVPFASRTVPRAGLTVGNPNGRLFVRQLLPHLGPTSLGVQAASRRVAMVHCHEQRDMLEVLPCSPQAMPGTCPNIPRRAPKEWGQLPVATTPLEPRGRVAGGSSLPRGTPNRTRLQLNSSISGQCGQKFVSCSGGKRSCDVEVGWGLHWDGITDPITEPELGLQLFPSLRNYLIHISKITTSMGWA